MADNVVNLRQARKTKARAEKEVKAEQNRKLHGRTKAQKDAEAKSMANTERHLDGHKRERD